MKALHSICVRRAVAGALMALLAGCGGSGADSREAEGIASSAQGFFARFDFGGAWGYINGGQLSPNPATGAASCPAGFTAQQVLGTSGTDWPVYECYRPHVDGTDPLYDFGGMYGHVNAAPAPNPLTGDMTCPAGFTGQVVLGTTNVDWTLTVCYRTYVAGNDAYANFGGMYGYVNAAPADNPATQAMSCPGGYLSSQVLGTYNVDWSVFFCYQPVVTAPLDFGGMWGYVNATQTQNPATGAASCPAGYTATPAFGTNSVDYSVHYCWRPHLNGRDPIQTFGGMWGYVNATQTQNPATGQASCPAGYTAQQVLGTYNVDWELYYCYLNGASGAPAELFGGMLGTVNAQGTSDPVTGQQACPPGYGTQQVLGTTNVDWPLSYCYVTPCPGQVELADTGACVTLAPWDGSPLASGTQIVMQASQAFNGYVPTPDFPTGFIVPIGPSWVMLNQANYLGTNGPALSSGMIFTVTSVPKNSNESIASSDPGTNYEKLLLQSSDGTYVIPGNLQLFKSGANQQAAEVLLLDLTHGTQAALWSSGYDYASAQSMGPDTVVDCLNFMQGGTSYGTSDVVLTAAAYFNMFIVNP